MAGGATTNNECGEAEGGLLPATLKLITSSLPLQNSVPTRSYPAQFPTFVNSSTLATSVCHVYKICVSYGHCNFSTCACTSALLPITPIRLLGQHRQGAFKEPQLSLPL